MTTAQALALAGKLYILSELTLDDLLDLRNCIRSLVADIEERDRRIAELESRPLQWWDRRMYEEQLTALRERCERLEEALRDIHVNCNGYGLEAGWAANRALKALAECKGGGE